MKKYEVDRGRRERVNPVFVPQKIEESRIQRGFEEGSLQ